MWLFEVFRRGRRTTSGVNDVAVSVLGVEGPDIQGRSIGADTQVLGVKEQSSRTNRRAASGSGISRVESSAVRATVIVHSPVPVMLTVPVAHAARLCVMKVWMSDVVGCVPSRLSAGRSGSAVNVA